MPNTIYSRKLRFLQRAFEVHGDFYDYSEVDYVNDRTKVKIICPIHGAFWQTPNNHFKYCGCKKCATTSAKNRNLKSRQYIIDLFIAVHGDRYDYSELPNRKISSKEKVIIGCKDHGTFEQEVYAHSKGGGCRGCAGCKPLTIESFIENARLIHGDLYNYDDVDYVNSTSKVKIWCKEPSHGIFEQIPSSHLRGCGCPTCAINIRAESKMCTSQELIALFNEIHNGKYEYPSLSSDRKIPNKEIITILCLDHGPFQQRVGDHKSGHGCSRCRPHLSLEDFIKRSIEMHGGLYNYDDVDLISTSDKVIIGCKDHGPFEQIPSMHMRGVGCPTCANRYKMTTEDFIRKARLIHGDKYYYQLVNYTLTKNKVIVICSDHGPFEQRACSHIHGEGCPVCPQNAGYSKKAIQWLTLIEVEQNILIHHALNGGEYKIPGTRYRVDGFCYETNTVYEFYGDVFHGNLNIFDELDTCHPFTKKVTAKDLYDKTMKRELIIRELGYNVITIWENDFKKILSYKNIS